MTQRKLTPQKLTNIWKSGYCRVTVEYTRTETDNSLEGGMKRTEFMQVHMCTCMDCYFASQLKIKESEVAKSMGPTAHAAFFLGEDVTKMPGYTRALLSEAMNKLRHELHQKGYPLAAFNAWLARAAARKAYKLTEGDKTR